jgi:hypothetical protein
MRSDAFVRGIRGPIGSGKSTACVMELLRRCKQQEPGPDGKRRARWAVVRNTYPELKTTTIKTWHQWVPQTVGRWQGEGPPTHFIDEGELSIEVMFIALDSPDDVRKLLSLELTGAWINEAREVPKAVLDGLTGRVGRYPSKRDGGASWCGIIMDTNPPDDDHWWYRLAEEQRPDGWEFFAQPGGLDPAAENLQNLPAGYYERASAGKDDDWIKVYVRGEYGFVRSGKPVYPDYRDGTHCREFEIVPALGLHIGIDFGLTPAATLGQRTAMGAWRVFDELVTEDMGAKNFAAELRRLLRERYPNVPVLSATGDPAGDIRAQTDEVTPFQILRSEDVIAVPASTNDFVKRTEAVRMFHNRMVDGEPAYLVHPRCKALRKAKAGRYQYKRLAVAGDERFRDVPDKNAYSHVAEAEQYMLVGAGEARALIRPQSHQNRPTMAVSDYNILA